MTIKGNRFRLLCGIQGVTANKSYANSLSQV